MKTRSAILILSVLPFTVPAQGKLHFGANAEYGKTIFQNYYSYGIGNNPPKNFDRKVTYKTISARLSYQVKMFEFGISLGVQHIDDTLYGYTPTVSSVPVYTLDNQTGYHFYGNTFVYYDPFYKWKHRPYFGFTGRCGINNLPFPYITIGGHFTLFKQLISSVHAGYSYAGNSNSYIIGTSLRW